jgi:hypothetical protein
LEAISQSRASIYFCMYKTIHLGVWSLWPQNDEIWSDDPHHRRSTMVLQIPCKANTSSFQIILFTICFLILKTGVCWRSSDQNACGFMPCGVHPF